MSMVGRRIRNSRIVWPLRNMRAEQISPAAEPSPGNTPYWLLWSTGIATLVLCFVAFVLWGINGASTLFDMIVALCT